MLELLSVSKRYPKAFVVRDVSLTVQQGECRVLLGPSGCGKSTLLRMIVGLIAPDGGEIKFSGEQLTKKNLSALRLKMGYVIQIDALFPHLTAGENATIVARKLKWSKEKIKNRLHELCELARFPTSLLLSYPAQLSGGEKQRLSLIRALMLDPEILFLDEPLGALDPITRKGLQFELKELFSFLGKTVVLVTHDIAEAKFFADSISIMRGGHLLQTGSVDEILEKPLDEFITEFMGA